VIHVHLTQMGREKLETVFPGHVAALVDEFSVLTQSEQEKLAELCRKLGKGKEGS
jgi:DNA-binding MarR family transcriptional regulator